MMCEIPSNAIFTEQFGICGQGPSGRSDPAKWLMEEGIESLSLNPDTAVETWLCLAREAGSAAPA